MATWWSPDTCDCIIELKADATFNDFLRKCNEHKGVVARDYFDAVIAHNISFRPAGDTPTQREQYETDKRTEKQRIRSDGPSEDNPDRTR